MIYTSQLPAIARARKLIGLAFMTLLLGLSGCHGHLKHIDGPGHSEDAPGQQKKY